MLLECCIRVNLTALTFVHSYRDCDTWWACIWKNERKGSNRQRPSDLCGVHWPHVYVTRKRRLQEPSKLLAFRKRKFLRQKKHLRLSLDVSPKTTFFPHDLILRSWYANKMFPHYFQAWTSLKPLRLVKDWLVAAGTHSNANAWFSSATTVGTCRRAPKWARKYRFDTTSHVRNYIEQRFKAASRRSRKSTNVQRVFLGLGLEPVCSAHVWRGYCSHARGCKKLLLPLTILLAVWRGVL